MGDLSSVVTAQYQSTISQQHFVQAVPAPSATHEAANTNDKTKYLASLRKATVDMQGKINKFLTHKMEEDKLSDAATGKTSARADEKAEEMYGEEVEEG